MDKLKTWFKKLKNGKASFWDKIISDYDVEGSTYIIKKYQIIISYYTYEYRNTSNFKKLTTGSNTSNKMCIRDSPTTLLPSYM